MDIFNTLANITRPAQSNNSNMPTIITTNYEQGMRTFLDIKPVQWKHIVIDEEHQDAIQIIFDRELTPNELWEFALEWKAWYIRIIL